MTLKTIKFILGSVASFVLIFMSYFVALLFHDHQMLCVMALAIPSALIVGFLGSEIVVEDRKYDY